jgi:hypothetical protein
MVVKPGFDDAAPLGWKLAVDVSVKLVFGHGCVFVGHRRLP